MSATVAAKPAEKKKSEPAPVKQAPVAERGTSSEFGAGPGLPLFLQAFGAAGALAEEPRSGLYEREADRVAEAVVSGHSVAHVPVTPVARSPQRRCAACEAGLPCTACAHEDAAPVIQRKPDTASGTAHPPASIPLWSQRGSGQALPDQTRARMESRFGRDFGGVRVHTDSSAASAARQLRAHAFTVGQDIYFGRDRFQPGSPAGDRLIAHELTHTVQQTQSDVTAPAVPHRATGGVSDAIGPIHRVGGPAVQRYGLDDLGSDIGGAASAVWDAGAEAVEAGAEFVGDTVISLVRRVAPGLADMIEMGPIEFIKRGIERAITEWLPSLFGGIDLAGVVAGFRSVIGAGYTALTDLLKGGGSACRVFANLLAGIRDFAGLLIDNPVVDALREVFQFIEEGFGKLASFVLAPVFDAIRDALGASWSAIKGIAKTISGWISRVRDLASRAWDFVAEQLGFRGEGSDEEGVFGWLKRKAEGIWSDIKATLAPVVEPLKKIGKIALALSPLGPVYLLIKYGPRVVKAVQWLWEHRDDPDIAQSARGMGDTMLPELLESVGGFRDHLRDGFNWLIDQMTALSEGFLELLGGLTGVPLLGMARGFVQTIANGIRSFVAWAGAALRSAAATVEAVALRIWRIVEPYKQVLSSIAMAIVNPVSIPIILAGWAWQKLPSCFKGPIINFLLDIAIRALAALPELFIFGPLWPILKSGVLGFLRGLRDADDQVKEMVSNRIATIMSGASPAFIFGFVKGFLVGVWEGITDPIKAIWMVVEGLNWVQTYLERLAGVAPAATASRVLVRTGTRVSGAAPEETGPPLGPEQQAELGQRVDQMRNELSPPVETVVGSFWTAVQEYFSSSGGDGFETLVTKLGEAWGAIREKIGEASGELAGKVIDFFRTDEGEGKLGEGVGWLSGTIVFQVLLDVITAGAWIGAYPVVQTIVRLMNWPMEVLGHAFRLLGKLGRYIVDGIKKLGGVVSDAAGGALKAVKEALGTIGAKLVAFAEEILARFSGGTARGASQLAEREAQQAATRKAASIVEQRGAGAAAREGEDLATREAVQAAEREADDLAMREAREAAERKGEGTAQREAGETAEEVAERPAAVAAAELIEVGMQTRGASIEILLATLNGLRAEFEWIDNFTAEREGSAHMIYMIGSKIPLLPYVPGGVSPSEIRPGGQAEPAPARTSAATAAQEKRFEQLTQKWPNVTQQELEEIQRLRIARGEVLEDVVKSTPEHQAQRWASYQERQGGRSFEQWSQNYHTGIRNADVGLVREQAYREALPGAQRRMITTPTGKKRQIDVYRELEKEMYEIKTGRQYLTTMRQGGQLPNAEAVLRDAEMVREGFKVYWVLEQGGSPQLLKALFDAGIIVKGPEFLDELIKLAQGAAR